MSSADLSPGLREVAKEAGTDNTQLLAALRVMGTDQTRASERTLVDHLAQSVRPESIRGSSTRQPCMTKAEHAAHQDPAGFAMSAILKGHTGGSGIRLSGD